MEEKVELYLSRAELEAIRRLLQGRRDYLRISAPETRERIHDLNIVDDAFSYISAKLREKE